MGSPAAGQRTVSKAQEYGLEGRSWPLRDILAAYRMVSELGPRAMLAHAYAILLMRVVWQLSDRKLQKRMPQASLRPIVVSDMELRTVTGNEAQESELSTPTPKITFGLTLRALGLDPAQYSFIDIGSGWGYATLLAAMRPFRKVSAVEFARELHDRATANIDWARSQGLLLCGGVDLRHESALETELPEGPLVVFLYNPFGAEVMAKFLDRVDASMKRAPRPIIAIYVRPVDAKLFERPGVIELPLRGLAALGLRTISPRDVRAWRWVQ
jgi:hypothetical protein